MGKSGKSNEQSKKEILKPPVNPLPKEIPKIDETEQKTLNIYLEEWKTIIQTQMHFNDLILRFRSIILTVFVALLGAIITIMKVIPQLSFSDFILLLAIPTTLWLTAFIIDYGYYHRLLMGSVAQALKFDNSDKFKRYGLFGLTTCIMKHVYPPTSKKLVCIYYLLPFVVIGLLIVIRLVYK